MNVTWRKKKKSFKVSVDHIYANYNLKVHGEGEEAPFGFSLFF